LSRHHHLGRSRDEGFTPKHSIAPPRKSAIDGVVAGTVDVCQSAPSQGFGPLEKGHTPAAVHFAQINEMDGFFLTAGAADPAFAWTKLRGARVPWITAASPLTIALQPGHVLPLFRRSSWKVRQGWRPFEYGLIALAKPTDSLPAGDDLLLEAF